MSIQFDHAQYRVALQRIESGMHRLAGIIEHPVLRAHPGLLSSGRELVGTVRRYLTGGIGPLHVLASIGGWGELRGLVSSVSGDLETAVPSVDYYWKGRAADAYKGSVPPHADAAVRLGAMADRTQTALTWSVAAAAAFYAGLVIVIAQLILVLEGVVAAASTVVLGGVAAGVGAGQILATIAELAVLVGLFTSAVTAQVIQMGNLLSESQDKSAFPQGHWPPSVTNLYQDATVTDGDAEWSLER